MKIGIIGAGNIGAILARKLVAAGHEIKLANSKSPESIRNLAAELGATGTTKEDAVKGVDVVILSIPFSAYSDLAGLFEDVPANVVVVDTSNYYPFRDGAISDVDDGQPEAVWVTEQINRPIIKAWNAVLAATLAEKGVDKTQSGRIALPVAGVDPEKKALVIELVEATGFDGLDAGSLETSWRQQPGTPAYCTELTADELRVALKKADQSRSAYNRETLIKGFMERGDSLTHDEIVARNRAVTA
ncbi:NADPH-dependent F420 reductase [Rhizobium rhizogenes]|uniref:3-hydroxyisobutyrate dehydrogenase protein n=1 Tax=Rhizobium rhizogenes (strain K84 / ATCC BAA-868) TaxID=311403 RepID=B9JIP1_RHIR8|nr:NAD(P)-binding domain-containing protein [Rhizobium rhizogenes]ACM29783.1 3-hydroxyisobutyrate dehydrogenase protein [Rhizobium rhizogenes K84]MDJ1635277.1 NAD(P)-binding domain-containing protein [Rhizobium rhizogenes]NTG10705.1 NAD(P)-binding domain-containing protein [Rhizobium rhizogenes]